MSMSENAVESVVPDPRVEAVARALCGHRSIGVYPTRSWDEQPQRVRDVCFEYAAIALAAADAVGVSSEIQKAKKP